MKTRKTGWILVIISVFLEAFALLVSPTPFTPLNTFVLVCLVLIWIAFVYFDIQIHRSRKKIDELLKEAEERTHAPKQ